MKRHIFLISVCVLLLLTALPVFAQGDKPENKHENKPLNILEKPLPALPYNHTTLNITGTVKIKVEFLSNGEIGQIEPVPGLPPELTQNAVDAAKKIKFEPEIKDGVQIGVYRIVEYPYSWNGGWKSDKPMAPDNKLGPQVEKAEAVIKRAVDKMGGEKYLQVRSVYGKGTFSSFKDGVMSNFSNFTDVIVFPDRERTDFKNGGYKTVQVNTGDTGWIFDEAARSINPQTQSQIDAFKRGLKVSIDNLLRGTWRQQGGRLSYAGRREASLGKRNEVIRITFGDDSWVEFEFSATDGLPAKAVYERKDSEGENGKEEDRYAQFVDIQGVMAPFIIDHFRETKQVSRINYLTLEVDKNIPQSVFDKPSDIKEAKKEPKF